MTGRQLPIMTYHQKTGKKLKKIELKSKDTREPPLVLHKVSDKMSRNKYMVILRAIFNGLFVRGN
jgi:hypothetical protein